MARKSGAKAVAAVCDRRSPDEKTPTRRSQTAATTARPSALLDTRVIYCGDNLEQLAKLPDACVDLIYIDPPLNSNRNYEVFWGETKEKRAFEDRHENTKAYMTTCARAACNSPASSKRPAAFITTATGTQATTSRSKLKW